MKKIICVLIILLLNQKVLLANAEPNSEKISKAQLDAQLLGAIENLDPNGVKAALDAGANANVTYGEKSKSAVHKTLFYFDKNEEDCLAVLNYLFNAGAKLQPYDSGALFWAIAHGFPSVTEFLIKKGASPTQRFEGLVPIEWAYHYGRPQIAKILLRYGAKPISERDADTLYFIYLAGSTWEDNRLENMGKLLAKKIYIDDTNPRGETALLNAVGTPPFGMDKIHLTISYLIEKGADVNKKGKAYDCTTTALHTAIYTTSFWFNSDPKKDKERNQQERMYSEMLLKKLLEAGAYVSALDEYGRTPLHIASKHNNVVGAKILIDAGAKIMPKDKEGKTPLDYAESTEMIELLKSHGAKEF